MLVDEEARRAFELAWHGGRPEPIERFLPAETSSLYLGTLLELVQIEMELGWKTRQSQVNAGTAAGFEGIPRAETYLAAYPKLAEPGLKLDLARHEYDVRQRFGDKPSVDDYRTRFPDLIVTGEELTAVSPDDETNAMVLPEVPGFRVLGILGHGGMGVVYRACQVRLKRDVALKMLSAGPMARADEMGRFLTEAESVARLQHPNIVQIFEVGEFQGRPFLALELVDGGSLAQRLCAGPLPATLAARWMETLARTMQHVHEHGIVHRDLKPANVLITSDGVLKITDFGLAKRLGEAGSHTISGAVMGTASYASPEQASGKTREVGPAADVYGLGAIFYEMLTGRPPFQAESTVDTILQVLQYEPVSVTRLRPRTSPDLETICHKCLQKEPQKRYASAGALAEDLRRFLAGEPIQARPISRLGRAWRWARRNPALAGTGIFAFVFLVATSILSTSLAFHHARAVRAITRQKAKTEAALAQVKVALAEAQAENLKNSELSGGLLLDEAVNYCQQGDVRAGLLRMIRPLQLSPAGPSELQWAARTQLSAWGREVNAPLLPPLMHSGSVAAAAFNDDGTILVTGSEDLNARLWNTATGSSIGRPMRHNNVVGAVAFSSDGNRVVTGSDDGTARVWDGHTAAPIGNPLKHEGPVRFVAFTPNGKTIVTGSLDQTVRLWDAEKQSPLGPPLQAGGPVAGLAISPDGTLLAVAAKSEVRMWDIASGQPVGLPLRHDLPVTSVAFSDDGKRIATGCGIAGAGYAMVWDVGSGDPVYAKLPHPDRVGIVAFQPGGGLLATACDDGSAQLWRVDNGQPFGDPMRHRANYPIRALAFSRDGKKIATGGADSSARVWDALRAKPIGTAINQEPAILVVAFNPDGSTLLTAGNDNSAKLWAVAKGQMAGPAVALDHPPRSMALSADGRLGLVITAGGAPVLEDARTGQAVGVPLKEAGSEVLSVALSPDGSIAMTGSRDRTARLWEARTGKPIGAPLVLPDAVHAVAIAPDGSSVATGSDDKMVRIWDVATRQMMGKPLPQRGPVRALAYSPDSRLLLAGCAFLQDGAWRGQARLWDIATGTAIGPAMRHQEGVTCVAFSRDGRIVATGSHDRTARFWEAASGRPIGPPLDHPGDVVSVGFSDDGRTLITRCSERPENLRNRFPSSRASAQAPSTNPSTAPSTEPTTQTSQIVSSNGQFTWRTPLPAEGTLDQLATWAEVLTDLEFDTTTLVHRLDDNTWKVRWEKLKALGEPVMP